MKVVLFCGGPGTRLWEEAEAIPKPMVPLGYRPVLWHVMKYYAHYGHTDFILALGAQAEAIKDFFLHYDEALTNDFVMSGGGRQIDYISTDIHEWKITFADTGVHSSIADRLRAVRRYVGDDEMFLANYSDGLTDLSLDRYIADFSSSANIANVLLVQPPLTYHEVTADERGQVTGIEPVAQSGLWINGGYFVFRAEIFDYIEAGDDIATDVFRRLIKIDKLGSTRYEGFWAPLDTFKDKQRLDEMFMSGAAPWEVWKDGRA